MVGIEPRINRSSKSNSESRNTSAIKIPDRIRLSTEYNSLITLVNKDVVTKQFEADPGQVHQLPLHIKVGLTTIFVNAMHYNGNGNTFPKNKFPGISDAQIKEEIFVGSQLKKLIQDETFDN